MANVKVLESRADNGINKARDTSRAAASFQRILSNGEPALDAEIAVSLLADCQIAPVVTCFSKAHSKKKIAAAKDDSTSRLFAKTSACRNRSLYRLRDAQRHVANRIHQPCCCSSDAVLVS